MKTLIAATVFLFSFGAMAEESERQCEKTALKMARAILVIEDKDIANNYRLSISSYSATNEEPFLEIYNIEALGRNAVDQQLVLNGYNEECVLVEYSLPGAG